ncbi:MAG: hypothetical protein ACK4NF_02305 [Planctomycetota bacterium]
MSKVGIRQVGKITMAIVVVFFGMVLFAVKPDSPPSEGQSTQPDSASSTKKSSEENESRRRAFLEELGALKGELRNYLSQAESIRKQILSKMYGIQARKAIYDKIKDFIEPAKELLSKCEEKEKNICVTPAVISDAYARLLEDERRRKFEEERAKMEQERLQRLQQLQQQLQQQQQQQGQGGSSPGPAGGIVTPPSS